MKDKIEGKTDQATGKIKEEAGKLGGDKSTELGGKWEQAKGHVKEGIGDAKMNVDQDTVER